MKFSVSLKMNGFNWFIGAGFADIRMVNLSSLVFLKNKFSENGSYDQSVRETLVIVNLIFYVWYYMTSQYKILDSVSTLHWPLVQEGFHHAIVCDYLDIVTLLYFLSS